MSKKPDRQKILDKWGARLGWMAENIYIVDIEGNLTLFDPNWAQMRLYKTMMEQEIAGVPIRVQVLKARRLGISTGTAALFYALEYENSDWRSFVCAHDGDSSDILFEMVRVMNEEFGTMRPTRNSNKKEIIWQKPHRGYYQVQTAGKLNLARGWTIQCLHSSEVAFWPHAAPTQLSVMNAAKRAYVVVKESTANGQGGQFYEDWNRAVQARRDQPHIKDGFEPIFFSWTDHPDYATPAPEGYDWSYLTEEEQDLLADGLSYDQLYWRRRTLEDECGNDTDLFHQEYPRTPEEAFLASGDLVVKPNVLAHHNKTVCEGLRAKFLWDPATQSRPREQRRVLLMYDDEFRDPYWELWEEPIAEHDYVIGGDFSKGELSDPDDDNSDRDSHCLTVLDRVTLRQVAMLHTQRYDADEMGEEMLKASIYYNGAWTNGDVTGGYGVAAMNYLKRWPWPKMQRQREADTEERVEELEKLWTNITSANRANLVDQWLMLIRPDSQGTFKGKLDIRYKGLLDEEGQFIRNRQGKRVHRAGAHDDCIWAMILAVDCHLMCPRDLPERPSLPKVNPEFGGVGYSGGRDTLLAGMGDNPKGGSVTG